MREDEHRPVYACGHCQLQFIQPLDGDLREYYRTEYRQLHDFHPSRALTPEERFIVQRPLMHDAATRFKDEVPEGASVLEVGCSSGYFLDALGEKYDRFGSEWNPHDAAYVRETGELPCEEGLLTEIYPGQTFTAIVALQVLEHQPDPLQFLRDCKERLIGGGWLYLELPSAMDALVTVYNIPEYRTFWYREPHITYWTRETLASALGALGFEAHVKTTQRYSFANHINWLLHREPMANLQEACGYIKPVSPTHPLAGVLNRNITALDKQYRVLMNSYGCADTIFAIARRREI